MFRYETRVSRGSSSNRTRYVRSREFKAQKRQRENLNMQENDSIYQSIKLQLNSKFNFNSNF